MSVLRYRAPRFHWSGSLLLVAYEGSVQELQFVFYDRIEIGRLVEGLPEEEGRLLIDDPTVSARHCAITRDPDGRCYIRDTSRNGTRVDGRRLMPNREVELLPGQEIGVGSEGLFRFIEPPKDQDKVLTRPATRVVAAAGHVSIVVGDIRGYSSLTEQVLPATLQDAVSRVFMLLRSVVLAHGGQVKEYQGDSLMAFWEPAHQGPPAVRACTAALTMHRFAQQLARDRELWPFSTHPLHLDWAVTTGAVTTLVLGDRPEELSMVGKPVVLAYRLEKEAGDRTGPILVCEETRTAAAERFRFRDVGRLSLDGFSHDVQAYALLDEREPEGPGPDATHSSPGPDA
jgi:class 3 adenylate cyclase